MDLSNESWYNWRSSSPTYSTTDSVNVNDALIPPSRPSSITTSIAKESDPLISELNNVGRSFNLSGLINPISSAIGSLINWFSMSETNKKNEALMREQWSREDTAFQRKVADLKAAGLNPKLAVNGSGSSAGGLVQFRAPTVESIEYDPSSRYYNKLTSELNLVNLLTDIENKTLTREYMRTNIDKNLVSIDNLNLQNRAASIKNIMLQLDLDYYHADKIFNYLTNFVRMYGYTR